MFSVVALTAEGTDADLDLVPTLWPAASVMHIACGFDLVESLPPWLIAACMPKHKIAGQQRCWEGCDKKQRIRLAAKVAWLAVRCSALQFIAAVVLLSHTTASASANPSARRLNCSTHGLPALPTPFDLVLRVLDPEPKCV